MTFKTLIHIESTLYPEALKYNMVSSCPNLSSWAAGKAAWLVPAAPVGSLEEAHQPSKYGAVRPESYLDDALKGMVTRSGERMA